MFLVLMYAGRVLKHGKTLDEYNIIEGVTIFFMKKKSNEIYMMLSYPLYFIHSCHHLIHVVLV